MRKLIPAVFALLAAGASHALGFGDLVLHSALNQPLDANVELLAVKRAERDSVKVQLAEPAIFERFGLSRSAALDELRIEVRPIPGHDNRLRVHLSTEYPVREPFLTFLLEANWSGGRALREYSVLLDPPVETPAARAPVATRRAPAPVEERAPRIREPEPAPERVQAPPRRSPTPAAVSGGRYGPIARNETLWSIARELRPEPGIGMNQMQIAIYRANPQAFNGNINRLLAGATLVIPDAEEARAIDRGMARREVIEQQREYERYRRTGTAGPSGLAATAAGGAASAESRALRLEPPSDEAFAAEDAGTPAMAEEGAQEPLAENPAAAARTLADAGRAATAGDAADGGEAGQAIAATEEGTGGIDSPASEDSAEDIVSVETQTVRDVIGGAAKPSADEATVVPEGSASPLSARNVLLLALAVLLVAAVTFVWLRRRQYKPLPADFTAVRVATRAEPVIEPEAEAGGAPETTPRAREEAVAELLADADGYIEQDLYDEALSALEVGLEEYPEDPDLQRKITEVHEAAAREHGEAAPQAPEPEAVEESSTAGETLADVGASKPEEKFELDFDLDDTESESSTDETRADTAGPAEQRPPALDVDLSQFETGDKDESADETAEEPKIAGGEAEEEDEFADFDVDSLSLDEEGDQASALEDLDEAREGKVDKPEFEAGEGLSLDEEGAPAEKDTVAGSGETEETPSEAAAGESSEEEPEEADAESGADLELDEVSTKLDLARAYLDMGEPDMARSLLDEVKDQGNAEQRREAEELLERAG